MDVESALMAKGTEHEEYLWSFLKSIHHAMERIMDGEEITQLDVERVLAFASFVDEYFVEVAQEDREFNIDDTNLDTRLTKEERTDIVMALVRFKYDYRKMYYKFPWAEFKMAKKEIERLLDQL